VRTRKDVARIERSKCFAMRTLGEFLINIWERYKDRMSEMKKVSVISFPTHMNEKVHAMKNTGCGNQNIK